MNRKVASVPGSSMTNDVGSIAAPIEGADLPALRRLAGARFGAGDLAGALALLDKALKLAPADLESHVLAARYLRWAERFGPAMAHARTALEVAPDHGEALWLLGSTARMAGDAETGVTIMQMDAGLDTGPRLLTGKIPIGPDTSAAGLHESLAELGARLIVEALAGLESGKLSATPQPAEGVTYAEKLRREEGRLDWREPAAALERRIRALTPWPGAWLTARGERVKVLAAEVAAGTGTPGQVLDDVCTVACGEGALRLTRIQRPGKSAMAAEACLRGFDIGPGDVLTDDPAPTA